MRFRADGNDKSLGINFSVGKTVSNFTFCFFTQNVFRTHDFGPINPTQNYIRSGRT